MTSTATSYHRDPSYHRDRERASRAEGGGAVKRSPVRPQGSEARSLIRATLDKSGGRARSTPRAHAVVAGLGPTPATSKMRRSGMFLRRRKDHVAVAQAGPPSPHAAKPSQRSVDQLHLTEDHD